MKIQCDCGNEWNVKIENAELHLKIKTQDKKGFNFTHTYNKDAIISCDKCGRKITWY